MFCEHGLWFVDGWLAQQDLKTLLSARPSFSGLPGHMDCLGMIHVFGFGLELVGVKLNLQFYVFTSRSSI